MDVALYFVIGLAAMSIPVSIWLRRRITKQLRANVPMSPLQILERRLAAGEISPEQYQYERYLLEKPE